MRKTVSQFQEIIREFEIAEDVYYYLKRHLDEHMPTSPERYGLRLTQFSLAARINRLLEAFGLFLIPLSLVALVFTNGSSWAGWTIGVFACIWLIVIFVHTPFWAISLDHPIPRLWRTTVLALIVGLAALELTRFTTLTIWSALALPLLEVVWTEFWFKFQEYRLSYFDTLRRYLWDGFRSDLSEVIWRQLSGYGKEVNQYDYYIRFISEVNAFLDPHRQLPVLYCNNVTSEKAPPPIKLMEVE